MGKRNEPVTIIVKHEYGDKPLESVMLPVITRDLEQRIQKWEEAGKPCGANGKPII